MQLITQARNSSNNDVNGYEIVAFAACAKERPRCRALFLRQRPRI